jgi:hypothetical protein
MAAACSCSKDLNKIKCDSLTEWNQWAIFIFHSQWVLNTNRDGKHILEYKDNKGITKWDKTNGVIKGTKNKKRWQFQTIHDHELSWYGTVMKQTNASYGIRILYLPHVSATLVAIFREVDYKWLIIKVFETMHKCQIGSNILYRIFCSELPWGWTRVWPKHVAGIICNTM